MLFTGHDGTATEEACARLPVAGALDGVLPLAVAGGWLVRFRGLGDGSVRQRPLPVLTRPRPRPAFRSDKLCFNLSRISHSSLEMETLSSSLIAGSVLCA